MPLRDEDIQRIGDYVKPWIRELVGTFMPQPAVAGIDSQLLERMVRVEEELKAQRELMDDRFRAVDRRFDELIGQTNSRFESMDKRFDDLMVQTNSRFESMDKRFDDLIGQTNSRFESMDKRFDDLIGQTNSRFDDLIGQSNTRFGDLIANMDKRFGSVDRRFNTLTWMIGVGFVVITSLTTVFALLA